MEVVGDDGGEEGWEGGVLCGSVRCSAEELVLGSLQRSRQRPATPALPSEAHNQLLTPPTHTQDNTPPMQQHCVSAQGAEVETSRDPSWSWTVGVALGSAGTVALTMKL